MLVLWTVEVRVEVGAGESWSLGWIKGREEWGLGLTLVLGRVEVRAGIKVMESWGWHYS